MNTEIEFNGKIIHTTDETINAELNEIIHMDTKSGLKSYLVIGRAWNIPWLKEPILKLVVRELNK